MSEQEKSPTAMAAGGKKAFHIQDIRFVSKKWIFNHGQNILEGALITLIVLLVIYLLFR